MRPETVVTGLRFGEGPTWRPDTADVICVSMSDGCLYRVDPEAKTLEVFADTAGSPNGTAPCADGSVLVAQNGGVDFRLVKFPLPALQERLEEMIPADLPEIRYTTPGVQRVHPDGSVTRMLGSDIVLGAPNDIVVAPDNSVIFSDTGTSWRNGAPQPVGTAGVYRYRPPGTDAWPSSLAMVEAFGRAELIVATRPNGIAVSPEGRILAVAEGGLRWLGSDGALAPFYEDAVVDGLTFDAEGSVYACIPWDGTILVIDADGKLIQELESPEGGMHPTNCCFGGEALGTLFVTDWNGGGRVLAWRNLSARGFAPPAYRD
jgi:sugar lactone lactonase YvrE